MTRLAKPPVRYAWAGIVDGEIHFFAVSNEYGEHVQPAIFATREQARREYQHVERVRVSVVRKP